jgi:hypothetical protein
VPAPTRSRLLGRLLFVVGMLAFGAVLALRPLGDPDLGWHVATGRVIVETRGIPHVDALAYTHRPVQRVDLVGDVALYLAYHLGGPVGLQLFGAALALAIAATMLALTRRSKPLAYLVVGLSMAAMGSWLQVRPVLLSFLYLLLLLLLLDTHRHVPRTRAGKRALWLVVPLLWLWSNTHGFVVLGAAISALYAGCALAARLARGRLGRLFPEKDGRAAGPICLVVATALLATLATSGGAKIYAGPARALNDTATVTEWVTTSAGFLARDEPAAGAVLLLAIVALLFGRERSGKWVTSAFDLGLVVAALVLGRSSVRFVPVAVLLLAPFIARRLARFVRPGALMDVVTGFSALLVAPALLLRPGAVLATGFDRRLEPEGAVQYVLAAEPRGPMWDFSPYGGYLSLRLYPRYLVLMDGRTAWVHDPALTDRVYRSNFESAAFEGLVREFGIEWAVSRAGPDEHFGVPLTRDPGWVMVYLDDYSAVYVRRDGPNRQLAERGYRLLNHLMPLEQVLGLAVSPRTDADSLANDAALAVMNDPSSPRATAIQACAAIRSRDEATFEAALRRLAVLAPGSEVTAVLQKVWSEGAARP